MTTCDIALNSKDNASGVAEYRSISKPRAGCSGLASSAMNFPSPCNLLEKLSLLTPPPSNEVITAVVRGPEETPRTHHGSHSDFTLPREFKKKCSISVFNDGPKPSNLESIKEEPINGECLKRTRGEVQWSPMKRTKTCVRNVLLDNRLGQEHKENSPIKVDSWGANNWFANKSLQPSVLFLKPPLRKLNYLCPPELDNCKDILSSLADRNMYNYIHQILGYLEPSSLAQAGAVSRRWRCLAMEVTCRRELREAKKKALSSKENIKVKSSVAKSRNETTPRKIIKTQNRIASPKRRVPTSPQLSPGSKRFRYFVEEGQAIDRHERLERCPMCKYPARRNGIEATCAACSFSFCPQCRCKPHPTKPCSFVIASPSSPSPRKMGVRNPIGSKASKKALRRL